MYNDIMCHTMLRHVWCRYFDWFGLHLTSGKGTYYIFMGIQIQAKANACMIGSSLGYY